MLKCTRFVFNYETAPDEVEDFILRSDDLAAQTYGRDKIFSRLNQVLDQARFLGWPLPRFGPNLPDDLTEIPPPGINHIFENQAKLLVDIAPVTQVLLENGQYCPVRMVCGTTAAGDLVWKCHLLLDRNGTPFIQRNRQQLPVKTKGTKIVCQTDTLPFDEKYMFECFGGEDSGIWPVPFLPEFFSDRPIAQKFSPEPGVVEVVSIEEKEPVTVFAKEMVPWYRPLTIDRSRALTFDPQLPINPNSVPATPPPLASVNPSPRILDKQEIADVDEDFEPDDLVEGWDDFDEEETYDLENEDSEEDAPPLLTNYVSYLTPTEEETLAGYDAIISGSQINTREEAESLRNDPKHKDRAEKWLLAVLNRLRLLANHSAKIGALISILGKCQEDQVLIIQPRQRWAENLVKILKSRGINAAYYDPKNKTQTSAFYEGNLNILVTSTAKEELFIEDLTVVSVASFGLIKWLDWLNPTQSVFTLPTHQLGFSDFNYVPEHPNCQIETMEYEGPVFDILDTNPTPAKTSKQKTEVSPKPKPPKSSTPKPKAATSSKTKKPKYKVKTGKGRPKSASSYEKALEIAKKYEAKGQACEILDPEGKDVLYSTGMPEQLQGELN